MTRKIIIAGDNNGAFGHIYIGVEGASGKTFFFGKYPDGNVFDIGLANFIDDGKIKVDNERLDTAKSDNNTTFFEKEVSVTDTQYHNLVDLIGAENRAPDSYTGLGKNCVDWIDDLLKDSGVRSNGLQDLFDEGIITTDNYSKAGGAGDYGKWAYGNESSPPPSYYDENWPTDNDAGYIPPTDLYKYGNDPVTGDAISSAFNLFNQAQIPIIHRIDPLVLDMDGDGVELVDVENSTVFFDLDNVGGAEKVGWAVH